MSTPARPLAAEAERARRLVLAFAARTGALPEGVWAAPGRVNLIGEHTDHSLGFALPIALEQRAWVAVRRRADDRVRLWSEQTGSAEFALGEVAPGKLSGWAAYVAGSAWAAMQAGAHGGGFDLLLDSDVPMAAGLSSSAAVGCASLLALSELWAFARPLPELARLAQRAENEIAQVPCGLLDPLASLCSEKHCALFIDFRSHELERLALPLEAAQLELLVIDTRTPRQLANGAYRERHAACREAARALGVATLRDARRELVERRAERLGPVLLRRARHVVSENQRVQSAAALLRSARDERSPGRLVELGRLLSASHASLRDDFEVSVPALDVAAAAAESAGALGARLVGGGFGGSVLALVRTGAAASVAGAVCAAFLARGWAAPATFPALPGAGASRVLGAGLAREIAGNFW